MWGSRSTSPFPPTSWSGGGCGVGAWGEWGWRVGWGLGWGHESTPGPTVVKNPISKHSEDQVRPDSRVGSEGGKMARVILFHTFSFCCYSVKKGMTTAQSLNPICIFPHWPVPVRESITSHAKGCQEWKLVLTQHRKNMFKMPQPSCVRHCWHMMMLTMSIHWKNKPVSGH